MHDIIIDEGNEEHNGRSYSIHIIKTGKMVSRKTRHIMHTPIKAEKYFRNQLTKYSGQNQINNEIYGHYKTAYEKTYSTHIQLVTRKKNQCKNIHTLRKQMLTTGKNTKVSKDQEC